METIIQSTEQSQQACKDLIGQTIYKWNGKFMGIKTPKAYCAETLTEATYNLLYDESINPDWTAEIYEIRSTLQAILVLLGKPGIIDQLQSFARENASTHIDKFIEFLNWIETDRINTLFDLEHLDHYPDPKWVDMTANHYKEELAK